MRLRKAIADLTLDKLILQEACPGKFLSPARRRACVEHIHGRPARLRASRLSGARPASLDTAQGGAGP